MTQHSQLLLKKTKIITTAVHDHMHARNCCYNDRHVHMLYNMCTLINNLKAAQFASVGKVHSSCVTDHVQPASAHIALAAFVGMCSSVLLNPCICCGLRHCIEEEGREQRVAVLQICNLLAITAPTSFHHH